MKCLIDTNILVSAALFPNSVPYKAFVKAATLPNRAIVCDYSLNEIRRVYVNKFPEKLHDCEKFLAWVALTVEIVPVPPESEKSEQEDEIRDIDDRPILRAAITEKVDVLLSGDKDFLESTITNPQIIKAADFIKMR